MAVGGYSWWFPVPVAADPATYVRACQLATLHRIRGYMDPMQMMMMMQMMGGMGGGGLDGILSSIFGGGGMNPQMMMMLMWLLQQQQGPGAGPGPGTTPTAGPFEMLKWFPQGGNPNLNPPPMNAWWRPSGGRSLQERITWAKWPDSRPPGILAPWGDRDVWANYQNSGRSFDMLGSGYADVVMGTANDTDKYWADREAEYRAGRYWSPQQGKYI